MWNDLSFQEFKTLAFSVRDNERIDWNTGEGICWRRLAPEELEMMQSLDLKWQECE